MADVAQSLVRVVQENESDRLKRLQESWNYYDGEFPDALEVRAGKPDHNVKVGLPALVVDKGVDFLFGKARDIEFQVPAVGNAEGGESTNPAQEAIDDTWEQNAKGSLLTEIGTSGGVTGHVFVKLRVEDEEFIRLINLDAQTVQVIYDDEDVRSVGEYRIVWTKEEHDPSYAFSMVRVHARRQRIILEDEGTWLIIDEESPQNASGWKELGREEWKYDFSPIVDWQNLPAANEFYGKSDIDTAIRAMALAINRHLSNMARIVWLHAHPKTVGTGFQASELKLGPEDIALLPKEGDLRHLEMTSDLQAAVAFYERLLEAFFMSARTPQVALGKMEDIGALSGLALEILHTPLLDKTETKRSGGYGDGLMELNRRIVALKTGKDDVFAENGWPQMLPDNLMELAQSAVLLSQVGVSTDSILERLGFDPETERQRREMNANEAGAAVLNAFRTDQG